MLGSTRYGTILTATFAMVGWVATSGCGTDGDTGEGARGLEPACAGPTTPACVDVTPVALDLRDDVADGEIDNAFDDRAWTSVIDARAGGAFDAVDDAYLYARFTDEGLEKVPLTDLQALTSMGWDIAFRRYVIRLNGGDSGPSCVAAAPALPLTEFDAVSESPVPADFQLDQFLDDTCGFVPDASGLPSAPNTALANYFGYVDCLQMTGQVYFVRLADGRQLKLVVDGYYAPAAAQARCNEQGLRPDEGEPAVFTVRWAFLDFD